VKKFDLIYGAFIGAVFICSVGGCEKPKAKTAPPPSEPQQIMSQSSGEGIVGVDAEWDERQLTLHLDNIPAGTSLSCSIDDVAIESCADLAKVPRPTVGNHILWVQAKAGGRTVAVGEMRFVVGGGSGTRTTMTSTDASVAPLTLEIDDAKFASGMAVKVSEGLTAKFRFHATPICTPKVECSFDSRSSNVWRLCDQATQQQILPAMMARGLQFLSVRAQCGDQVGPILQLHWFGVGDDYTLLGLQSTVFTTRKAGVESKDYVFGLVKANDCPLGLLKFECAERGADFQACPSLKKNPPEGFRIRANCNGQVGPVFLKAN